MKGDGLRAWWPPALLVLAWAAVRASSSSVDPAPDRDLIAAGAMYAPAMADGELWRLGCAPWLHRSWGHLAGNAVGLASLVWMGARWASPAAWFAAWWAGGASGALASWTLGAAISCGASGGLYALGAATCVSALRDPGALGAARAWRAGPVLAAGLALTLMLAVLPSRVDLAAHLGGAALGVVIGLGRPPRLA